MERIDNGQRPQRVRVMTYNIRHGEGNTGPRGAGNRVDLGRVAAVIRTREPDIVALQEVDRCWRRSGFQDQPARLAEMLGMQVCYAANVELPPDDHQTQHRQYGVAILSRFSIVVHRTEPLPVTPGWEPRGMLLAQIDLGGQQTVVVDTHLQVDQPGQAHEGRAQRVGEARGIVRAVQSMALPIVVMGDFNARPDDPELVALRDPVSGLRDAWQVAGHGAGATIPVSLEREPVDRIDYIFTTAEFAIENVQVLIDPATRIASDHYPVIADITLRTKA